MVKRTLVAATALALMLGNVPAGADVQQEVVATDAVGDANFVNGNGLSNLAPTDGPDTRPASQDGADIREIRYSTTYDTVKLFNPDGSVNQVIYNPTGLRIAVEMEGTILPTFGPSLIMRVITNVKGCDMWFEAVVRGSNAAAATDPQRASLRTPSAASCPNGAQTLTAGFQLDLTGDTMTMTYPFAALPGSLSGFLDPGTSIDPDGTFTNNANTPHLRTYFSGGTLTAPSIDETARPLAWTVGSDVPANVLCSQSPSHPDCQ